MASCMGYDHAIIVVNLLELCLSAVAAGLLGAERPPDADGASIKLTAVLATLVLGMFTNLVMIIRTIACSKTRIHLCLRVFVSSVGAVLLVTSAAFVIEASLTWTQNNDGVDNVKLWTIAALVITNSMLYLLDTLVILRFYMYTLFRDEGDY